MCVHVMIWILSMRWGCWVQSLQPNSTPGRSLGVTVTNADILAVGRVNINHMPGPCTGLAKPKYHELIIEEYHDTDSDALDTLWNMSLHLCSPRPAWHRMIQTMHMGPHPGAASILFLPMIDMDHRNLNCIFWTLQFLCNHAHYNVKPITTFDQPLGLKSHGVIARQAASAFHDIILQLGGFPILVSLPGCIGSGLQYPIEQVYAANTVKHMLTVKA